jgi:aspartyl-tRNA(Asn)/glutamyl-tRNA(Gln) amidotransferase subunit A
VLSHGYYDAYYLKAQKVRRLIKNDFDNAFKQCDIILGPTSPETAFKLGEKKDDPVTMYMADVFTIAVNLAGLPGLSMPAGLINGLPVGVQLISKHFDEASILNVAHQFQQQTDWHNQAPNLEETLEGLL